MVTTILTPEQKCVKGLKEKTDHYLGHIKADYMGTLRGILAMPDDPISYRYYQKLAALMEQALMRLIQEKEAKTEAKTRITPKGQEELQKKALIDFLYKNLAQNTGEFEKFKKEENTVREHHLMLFLDGAISRGKKKGVLFEHSDALVAFSRLACGENYAAIKLIELTRNKYKTVDLLRKSLEETDEKGELRSDQQKISVYRRTLNHSDNAAILSKHRDSYFDRFFWPIFAIFTGIGIFIDAAYYGYKAKNSYSNYGAFTLFQSDSENMMDGANNTIREYDTATKNSL